VRQVNIMPNRSQGIVFFDDLEDTHVHNSSKFKVQSSKFKYLSF
jgi:hypothetical protein